MAAAVTRVSSRALPPTGRRRRAIADVGHIPGAPALLSLTRVTSGHAFAEAFAVGTKQTAALSWCGWGS